jgi:FAD-dependent urate hydroxylase
MSNRSARGDDCEVIVIGAGPFGLAAAAHLAERGVATQVFGEPMSFWRHNMPQGMKLRSPWGATHISDPRGDLSLDAFVAGHGLSRREPLPLETFVDYGMWFQRAAVPDIDTRMIVRIESAGDGFRVETMDGAHVHARRVVMATGLTRQAFRPEAFADVPAEFASHASEHGDLGGFRGRRVAVIGRGQSACESAALLAESGARAEIISRGDIHWLAHLTDGNSTKPALWWLREALAAPSAVGPFPLSWLAEFPGIAWRLPTKLRDEFTQRCLKAGAAGWLKPRFGDVTINPGRTISRARAASRRIELELDNGVRTFDHVLLGTGYRVDIGRLGLLSRALLDKIDCVDGSPVLGTGFVSSVPGLHFVGSYAVRSYGPLLRFIAGAPFTAGAVTRTILAGSAMHGAGKTVRAGGDSFGTAATNPAPPR